ncbi:MAG: hypothetical protein LBJ65_15060 [Burkholderia sp.]|jgi:hypothetical protein|uniref:hypothetical protein n=1 Tax=Burkholderia sp. TaxID=36773 RepID=UPI002836357D|nr:hypothetical protein [Burkholderia sp.]MDR0242914.1 hypothetical protein [Burkholderia sp.]
MPSYIRIAGVEIDISHLAPTQHIVEVPLRGGDIKKMLVEVAYTNHCYSRSPRAAIDEQIPDGHLMMDGGKQRMFCDRRYSLSLNLPKIMDALIRSENLVWSVPGNNFAQVDLVEEEADGTVTEVTYYVLMQIRKHAVPNEPKCIKVRVETAYPEDAIYDRLVRKKPFNFRKLLACIWEGRDHNAPEPKPKPRKKPKEKK